MSIGHFSGDSVPEAQRNPAGVIQLARRGGAPAFRNILVATGTSGGHTVLGTAPTWTLEGADRAQDQPSSNPGGTAADTWTLYRMGHGSSAGPALTGGTVSGAIGATWTDSRLASLRLGSYFWRPQGTAVDTYARWGHERGTSAFAVIPDDTGLPDTFTPELGYTGINAQDDIFLNSYLLRASRMEIRFHTGVSEATCHTVNAQTMLIASTNYEPFDTTAQKYRIITLPDCTVGDGARVQAAAANSIYDAVPGVINVWVPTNESDTNAVPENGSLGNGAIVQWQRDFHAAIRAARPNTATDLVSIPPPNQFGTPGRSEQVDSFFTALAGDSSWPFNAIMWHTYPTYITAAGLRAADDSVEAVLTKHGLQNLPRFIDEDAGSDSAEFGNARPDMQTSQIMARALWAEGMKVPKEANAYYYVRARESGSTTQYLVDGYPNPAIQQLAVMAIQLLGRNPALTERIAMPLNADQNGPGAWALGTLFRWASGASKAAFVAPGMPDARLRLTVTGMTSGTLTVTDGEGNDRSITVTAGVAVLDLPDLLIHYVHLPAGVSAAVQLETIVPASAISLSANKATFGGGLAFVKGGNLRDGYFSGFAEGNYQASQAAWSAVIAGGPVRATFVLDQPYTVTEALLLGCPARQLQCAIHKARLLAVIGGEEVEVASSERQPTTYNDWRNAIMNGWLMTTGDGSYSHPLRMSGPVTSDQFILEVQDVSKGSAADLAAATADGASDLVDLTSGGSAGLSLGAGFSANTPVATVQRLYLVGEPAPSGSSVTGFFTFAPS